jgi:lipopolysaccharide export system protein LptA
MRFTALLTILAISLSASRVTAQTSSPGLPRLDLFGSGGGPRKQLGYEGTPLAKEPKAPKKAKGQTEITALEATFDQKTREAVFIDNVVVIDPEFKLTTCDRLTAFLKKAKEDADKPASEPPAAESLNAAPKGGGIDHAIAEANPGKQVTITQDKLEADGTITKNVGHGDKVTYDAKTGDIVLIGNPSVQQGINLCVALEAGTVMTLNRNGRMKVEGPHKTIIKDTQSADPTK